MLRFAANLSLLFRELPLPQRFAAAADAGFAAVEMQLPYEYPSAVLARAARAAGMPVVLINAPLGPDPTCPGIACRAELRTEFRAGLERAAEYAEALGAPCVNVLAGRASAAEHADCIAQLSQHLSLAAQMLARAGARPLLETINPLDVPGYCVPSFELAQEVLAHADARVGLQFDVYHAARLGLDPCDAFARHRGRMAHLQFADAPGRHEPGTGTIDFRRLFLLIKDSDYSGWSAAEYHPAGSTLEGLAWLRAAGT